jgi:hypothetical protein
MKIKNTLIQGGMDQKPKANAKTRIIQTSKKQSQANIQDV